MPMAAQQPGEAGPAQCGEQETEDLRGGIFTLDRSSHSAHLDSCPWGPTPTPTHSALGAHNVMPQTGGSQHP